MLLLDLDLDFDPNVKGHLTAFKLLLSAIYLSVFGMISKGKLQEACAFRSYSLRQFMSYLRYSAEQSGGSLTLANNVL